MADLGSSYPVPFKQVQENKEMKLKWLQSAKQERISKINYLKQAIEDLIKGKIPDLERQIMFAQEELKNLQAAEEFTAKAIDVNI